MDFKGLFMFETSWIFTASSDLTINNTRRRSKETKLIHEILTIKAP